MRITAFAADQLACISWRFQLSTFDKLSPVVDHKVSIMREGLANLPLMTTVRTFKFVPSSSENRGALLPL